MFTLDASIAYYECHKTYPSKRLTLTIDKTHCGHFADHLCSRARSHGLDGGNGSPSG